MHVCWYWCEGHGCLEGRRVRGRTSAPCLLTAVSHYPFGSSYFISFWTFPYWQKPASQLAAVWFFSFLYISIKTHDSESRGQEEIAIIRETKNTRPLSELLPCAPARSSKVIGFAGNGQETWPL